MTDRFIKPLDGIEAKIAVRPDGGLEFSGWHLGGFGPSMQDNMLAILDWMREQIVRDGASVNGMIDGPLPERALDVRR